MKPLIKLIAAGTVVTGIVLATRGKDLRPELPPGLTDWVCLDEFGNVTFPPGASQEDIARIAASMIYVILELVFTVCLNLL